jgi:hypothetical protein
VLYVKASYVVYVVNNYKILDYHPQWNWRIVKVRDNNKRNSVPARKRTTEFRYRLLIKHRIKRRQNPHNQYRNYRKLIGHLKISAIQN